MEGAEVPGAEVPGTAEPGAEALGSAKAREGASKFVKCLPGS